ncbi:cysteine-rich receptor-like protein kinase, partial [Trifolium medium]|nr:cysteine-rich receptor-like protein kinase [Trifolium medium]
MRFISEFHRNGKLTKGLNSTFIALIPKIDSPQRLNDFRPISLVGSLHKILAKVLVNRLRLVIGSVISEAQTAFVKDRQILDGILIANEVVDEARKSKKELMLFKVDFEKAYDFVDWGYLDDVMGKMSFPTLWRKWIKECVCTATASVNCNKSMLVGINIPDSWLGEAASALCCKVGNVPFLYLGLPIGGDPRRLGFWEPVLARLKNRLSGWKSRFLSFGGR